MGEGHLREEAKPKAKDDNERKVFEAADHERQEAEECGLSVIALRKEKWAKRKAEEEAKRKAKEEVDRIFKRFRLEELEAMRKAIEEAERKAKEDAVCTAKKLARSRSASRGRD